MVLPPLDPDVIFADSSDIPSESENGSYHCSDSENCEWGSCCDGNHSYSQSYLDFLEEEEASSNYEKAMAKAKLTREDATKGEEEKAVAESDEGRCPDLKDEGEVAPDSMKVRKAREKRSQMWTCMSLNLAKKLQIHTLTRTNFGLMKSILIYSELSPLNLICLIFSAVSE